MTDTATQNTPPNVSNTQATSAANATSGAPGVSAPQGNQGQPQVKPQTAESTKTVQRHSNLITNPAAPPETVREVPPEQRQLPQSTIEEMAAGKRALERNRPTAQALEEARAAQDKDKSKD